MFLHKSLVCVSDFIIIIITISINKICKILLKKEIIVFLLKGIVYF